MLQPLHTYHQVSGAQKQNYPKDIDHAGGENAIPGPKKHRLPHEQLDPPPWLVETLHIKDS